MRVVTELANIELRHGDDGFWLCVRNSKGDDACISLANVYGDFIGNTFRSWATEQFVDRRRCKPELADRREDRRTDQPAEKE